MNNVWHYVSTLVKTSCLLVLTYCVATPHYLQQAARFDCTLKVNVNAAARLKFFVVTFSTNDRRSGAWRKHRKLPTSLAKRTFKATACYCWGLNGLNDFQKYGIYSIWRELERTYESMRPSQPMDTNGIYGKTCTEPWPKVHLTEGPGQSWLWFCTTSPPT